MRIAYTDMNLNFKKQNGLIPAIIQDAHTCKVLMLGFMNKAAYDKTRETKRVTFYSLSKKRLWTKGETSGNYLEVVDIKPDCDGDALLINALPKGPACHSGAYSCFGESPESLEFLLSLYAVILERKEKLPQNSYTANLFKKGTKHILEKVKEESQEVLRAVQSEGKERTIEEISDLTYHLFVLMSDQKIELGDIILCLQKRHKERTRL